MTKPPGLTEAMRRVLEDMRRGVTAPGMSRAMHQRLSAAALIAPASLQIHMETGAKDVLTPRGQAALAAPRVTALELESLCAVERSGIRQGLGDRRLDRESWITRDYVGAPWKLTPAGTAALNNVRAASGSPEWKP